MEVIILNINQEIERYQEQQIVQISNRVLISQIVIAFLAAAVAIFTSVKK